MTRWRGLIAAAGLAAVVAGCRARSLAPEEQEFVRVWLLCDDCTGGERARVAALGNRAVPTLGVALMDGPSPAGRANIEAQLRDLYFRLGPLPVTEAAFVSDHLANYVATWRERAAVSLGDIGTAAAFAALEEALADTTALEPGTLLAARRSHALRHRLFTGAVTDSVVRGFDTVTVRRGSGAWDGDETVSLVGAPFPNDLIVHRDLDSIKIVAAAPPGAYQLLVEGEPAGPARAPLRITTIRYAPSPATSPRELAAGAATQVLLLALWPPAIGDTIDHVRVLTPLIPSPRLVTADWSGSGNVDLRWAPCPGDAPLDPGQGATANRPEVLTLGAPDPPCRLIQVVLRAPHGESAIVRLRVSPP